MNFKISSIDEYKKFYQESLKSPDQYWNERAQSYSFHQKWSSVQSGDFNDLAITWFKDAKLNITENCLDRHVKVNPDKIAIYWEPNGSQEEAKQFSYKEVLENVNQISNMLISHGVKKGDRICLYMSMIPELLFATLACARVGAIHSVVFAGFSATALRERINDSKARFIFTNDQALRGDKMINLKDIVDQALTKAPSIEQVFVAKRTGKSINMQKDRDFYLDEEIKNQSKVFEAISMDSEDPLFILYTSGSTGKPKGLLHTIAGYMLWSGESFKNIFQVNQDDIFWCTADIGWITGHSYLTYGPLLNGVSQVMFEGVPTYPDAGRFWQICDKYQVSHFYTAPTAIRSLEAHGEEFVNKYKLNTLKVLGSVGEPINEEAWQWYHKNIGKEKCPIVDTWWQTETGGIMISNIAGITPAIPTYATLAQPGVQPVLVDNDGHEIKDLDAQGNLCIARPWPGIARTIYGDHERYKQTYFTTYKGLYFTGDGAKRDEKGNYRITGRVDDVLNVSGHRIGTAQVEDAINEHKAIVESAVIGINHPIKGQAIMAYVISNKSFVEKTQSQDELKNELNQIITKLIGPIAKIDQLLCVTDLPKTRSGKIMRRILRKLANKEFETLGDISTLLNPDVVDEIKKKVNL